MNERIIFIQFEVLTKVIAKSTLVSKNFMIYTLKENKVENALNLRYTERKFIKIIKSNLYFVRNNGFLTKVIKS